MRNLAGPGARLSRTAHAEEGTSRSPAWRVAAFWLASLALPVAVMGTALWWCDVFPFGEKAFLVWDLGYQYIDFFNWFARVLHGQAVLSHTFDAGLGSATWGLYAYYLASPLNALVALVPRTSVPSAIAVICLMKVALANASAVLYLRRRFSLPPTWALLLATSFTCGTWAVTNLRNPLWLDVLIFLPLAALGVHRLVTRKRWMLLATSTAGAVITCWYMGYVLILFLGFFAILELVAASAEGTRLNPGVVAGAVARFVLAMFTALALSAWIFVPTVIAMAGGPKGMPMAGPTLLTSKRLLLLGLLPGTYVSEGAQPQFYAGLVALVCALLFLLARRIAVRTRVVTVLVGLVFLGASALRPLQFVWSGLREPNGFYSRSAFMVAFMVLWAAGCFLSAQRPLIVRESSRTGGRCLRLALVPALLVLTCGELVWNASVAMDSIYREPPQERQSTYIEDSASQLEALRARTGLAPNAFARMDKTYTRLGGAALNEGMAQGYQALSTYSSTAEQSAVAFLNAMGYSHEGEFSTRFAGPNPVMDSLLGLRFMASETTPALYPSAHVPTSSAAISWYENPEALSLGFPAAAPVLDFSPEEYSSPFERQNALIAAITGEATPLLTRIDAAPVTSADGTRTWEVTVPAGHLGLAYVVPPAGSTKFDMVKLRIDGGIKWDEAWRFAHAVRELGPVSEAPTTHRVALLPERPLSATSSVEVWSLDLARYRQVFDELRSEQFVPEVFTGDHVAGTYTARSDENLLLTIPLEQGWTYTVNGTEVEAQPVADGALTVLPVRAGENRIELRYHTPGLMLGSAITALTVCGLIGHSVRRTRARMLRPVSN